MRVCTDRRWFSAVGLATVLIASVACSAQDPVPTAEAAPSRSPQPAASASGTQDPVTRFGAAPEGAQGEGGYAAALERADRTLGQLEVVRLFYKGLPDPWPGKAPGRDVVVSFKIDPKRVLSGAVDDTMRAWYGEAPRDLDVNWVYYHEPENDIEDGAFSSADFRAAFAHLSELSREVANPRLRATLVLQSYTLKPASGRQWRDYYPGDAAVDVFAWDVYNRPSAAVPYSTAEELLDGPRQVSASTGRSFAVAELGSVLADGDDGTGRAAWLRAVGQYAKKHRAEFVTYFDVDFDRRDADYRLRDAASLAAWRALSDD